MLASEILNLAGSFHSPRYSAFSLSVSLCPDSSDAVPDCAPLCLTKRQAEVAPAPMHADTPSGTPLGRRGRLANLAATIGSWEDDLSHAHIPSEASAEKTSKSVTKAVTTGSTVTASTSANQVGSPSVSLSA